MNPFALCSSRVCTPDGVRPASVVVNGARIASIESTDSLSTDIESHDFGDLVIAPGLIDTHVHINDPGSDWEGFETATRAAAAGGITTVIDMPLNSLPVTTSAAALQKKRAAAQGNCWVDVGFYGGLVPGNIDQIQELIAAGVVGIKAFLCHSGLEEFPNVDESELVAALPMLKVSNIPLLVHAELIDEDLSTASKNKRDYFDYLATRPDVWETNAIEMLIGLSMRFDAHIHIVHLATWQALSRIAAAKADGVPITVETCPHYLYFASEQIPDGATQFKCAPPIREKENQNALCKALVEGLIDSIGSDHSPCPPSLKRMDEGDFAAAWGGIAGLQLILPVVWTVGQQFGWRLAQLVKWLSHNPAKLAGLENQKGQLVAGFDADIVVWDPDAQFEVDQEKLFHRHACTPYDRCVLQGVVRQTYVRGQLVFNNGQHTGSPIGKLIVRDSNHNNH